VRNLTGVFANSNGTLAGVENWDVSRVLTFTSAFANADGFNRPIGTWNTGEATAMNLMFANTEVFNQPLGAWNTARVTTMAGMFQNALAFNQPIGTWNVRTVSRAGMGSMFQSTTATPTAFTQNLSGWCASHVSPRPVDFATLSRLAAEPAWGVACPPL